MGEYFEFLFLFFEIDQSGFRPVLERRVKHHEIRQEYPQVWHGTARFARPLLIVLYSNGKIAKFENIIVKYI